MGSNRKRLPKRTLRRRRILLPYFDEDPSPPPAALARALDDKCGIIVLGLVHVPGDHSLSEATGKIQTLRTRLRGMLRGQPGILRLEQHASHNPEFEIAAYAAEHDIDLILLRLPEGLTRAQAILRSLLSHTPSNLAVISGEPPLEGGRGLVVLRAGRDSELALRLGLSLTRTAGYELASLRPMQVSPAHGEDEAIEGLEQVLEHLPEIQDEILLSDDPNRTILEHTKDFDLVVVGAGGRRPADATPDALADLLLSGSDCPVLIVRSGRQPIPELPAELAGVEAISILVDKWFAENTFHSGEFENLERLLHRKEEQGITISLALPALNEEQTVGNVISTIKRALLDEVPLLDEMVLIDSNSTDRTREIARECGIDVYIHQEILPEYGSLQGKGEALWKSLFVTRGDIVLWIDTDIVNIHPRFVYGLIGPLLHRPDLMFIKGFYLRPLRVGKAIQAGGGGRVTELTARPLLNLFYPALSGFVQPLSGEYGGRREALEKLPFSTGYGVETGLLIDMLETFGLDAIAQVDLIRRVHHNQPLTALSKMSFAIIQTVIRKLDRRYGLQLLRDVNRAMKVIRQEASGFFIEVEEVAERERPPMITLPEYRLLFHREAREPAPHD